MGHNNPGMIVPAVRSVYWKFQHGQTKFDEFLDDFAMEKVSTKLFNCWLCYIVLPDSMIGPFYFVIRNSLTTA